VYDSKAWRYAEDNRTELNCMQGLKWGRVSRVGDPALIYLPFICRVYTGSLVFTALARIITAILQINEGVMGKNEVT